MLNLSRRGAGRQAASLSESFNSTQDKISSLGSITSDRESPSSSSSTACTTSSGYPRPKRSKRSENNDGSETNEDGEDKAMTKVQKADKDKEDACDIDENFLGEVKQEPMSPQGVSPPRSDPSTIESSFNSSSISNSSAPLTRHSARAKLKNEWPKITALPTLQAFNLGSIYDNKNNARHMIASSQGGFQNATTLSSDNSPGLLLFLANPVVENPDDSD